MRYFVHFQSVFKMIMHDLCAHTSVIVTTYSNVRILYWFGLQHLPLLLSIRDSTATKTVFCLPLWCLSDE